MQACAIPSETCDPFLDIAIVASIRSIAASGCGSSPSTKPAALALSAMVSTNAIRQSATALSTISIAAKRVGVQANFEIDRFDYGLTWNNVLETGELVVGKMVEIELMVEAIEI